MRDRKLVCPRCCAEIRREDECRACSWFSGPARSAAPEISSESQERLGRALALLGQGKVDEVAEMLRDVQEPDNYLEAYAKGCLHGARAEHERAVYFLRRAVEMFPEFMEAHYHLGSECMQAMDLTGAVRAYRRVVALGRPGEEFHDHAAAFLTEMEEQLLADEGLTVDQYLEAVDAFDRGFQAMRSQDFEGALPHLCRSLELSDSHAHPHGVCGLCHAFLGNKEAAHEALQKAVDRDAEYSSSLVFTMAREVLKGGKKGTADAIRELEQALNCPTGAGAASTEGE
jgi:tetratricopeptide (TPR) repeat protein